MTQQTGADRDPDPDSEGLSLGSYVRLTVLNRVSLLGLVVAGAGVLVTALTSPGGPVAADTPLLGGGLLLVGLLVFAAGFTLGQRTLGEREDW